MAVGGLGAGDVQAIRDGLAAGRRPRVVFTASAGQVAGQVGQVVALTDPAASDDWLVVRFGKDELPFSPTDLRVAPKGAAGRAAKSVPARPKPAEPPPRPEPEFMIDKPLARPARGADRSPGGAARGGVTRGGVVGGAGVSRTLGGAGKGGEGDGGAAVGVAASRAPRSAGKGGVGDGGAAPGVAASQSPGAADKGGGGAEAGGAVSRSPGGAAARSNGASNGGPVAMDATVGSATSRPAKAISTDARDGVVKGEPVAKDETKPGADSAPEHASNSPAPARKPGARAGKPKAPAGLTVTLAYADGEWTVSAQQGAKVLARPYEVRPAEALRIVSLVDVPGVKEAVQQILSAGRAEAQERADKLRAELAEIEERLAELRDAG